MQYKKEDYTIEIDLDRDRIKTILSEAYTVCQDVLGVSFNITREEFVLRASPYLDSNRVSTEFRIGLPSYEYPELLIEINPRKRSIISRMHSKDKRVLLNRFLTKL
jgi:hypothetical protein